MGSLQDLRGELTPEARMQTLERLWRDESGAEMTEYSLVIGVVAVGLIAVLVIFRGKISALFTRIGTQLDTASP
jgi:pilus assembly protein Flp/PilA